MLWILLIMARAIRIFARLILVGCVLIGALTYPSSALAKTSPEKLVTSGTAQLAQFEWQTAYDLFGQALEAAPESSAIWQDAAFGRAVAANQLTPSDEDRIEEAKQLFTKLSAPELKSRFAARSLMNLGRIAELVDYSQDPIDLPTARTYYAAVVERFPDDAIAHEATLRLAAAYVQSYRDEDVKQGTAILEKWLATHPQGPWASAMWQYLGDTYFFPLADYGKSLAAYERADELGWLDDADIGRVWWRIAKIAEANGNIPAAVKFYTRIVTDAPVSGKGYESQVALKRLGAPVPELRIDRPAGTKRPPTTAPVAVPTTRHVSRGDHG
jgi:tetratricopeptide (TPR) repeat protein